MNAIDRLKASGLKPTEIARRSGLTYQAVKQYASGARYPNQQAARALVALAESRGITLLATDFLPEPSAAADDTTTPLRAAS